MKGNIANNRSFVKVRKRRFLPTPKGGGFRADFSVKVLEQYATLGQFDFVHVIEAPDNETIARVSMELIARGHLKPLTMPTISINDFISRLSLDRRP